MESSNENEDVYSWHIEYAKSGRSTCHASNSKIPKGAVRIGAEVDSTFIAGAKMYIWYLPEALFDRLHKGAATRTLINSVNELNGFSDLAAVDQAKIRALIETEAAFRKSLDNCPEEDTKYFQHPERKFWWSIFVAGSATRTTWARIGEAANVSEKRHESNEAAANYKTRMVNEKLRKGYIACEKTATQRSSLPAAQAGGPCNCNCGCKLCSSQGPRGMAAEDLQARKPCAFFSSAKGCTLGEACQFWHNNEHISSPSKSSSLQPRRSPKRRRTGPT